MELELSALQLSRPATQVTTKPFFVAAIDDYLPSGLYEELLATYPDPSNGFNCSMKNFLQSGTEEFNAFLRTSARWADLLRYMDSDEFLTHVYNYTRPVIEGSRSKRSARPWCRNGIPLVGAQKSDGTSASSRLLSTLSHIEIETGFELSSMENGHCITPHSDAPYKLVSVLVYFPFPDWRDEWGGGTQFFRPLTPEAERRWCVPDINHVDVLGGDSLKEFARDMECFHVSPFLPNRLTMFCKSDYTFHAVEKISCPRGRRRNALVFNINIRKPAWRENQRADKWVSKGEQWIRRGKRWIREKSEGRRV